MDVTDHVTSALLLLLLACVVVIVMSTAVWRRWHDWMRDARSGLPLPPGCVGWPLVGETIAFILQGGQFYVDRFRRHGLVYKTHLLGSPTVRVAGASHIRRLVGAEPHGLSMKIPASARAIFGPESVICAEGQGHARVKKKLLEAFTPTRLSDYLPSLQEHVRRHVTSWCGRGKMLAFPACERLTGDVILELVLGCRWEDDPSGTVRQALVDINNNIFSAPFDIPGGGFHKAMTARRVVREFVMRRLEAPGSGGHVSMVEVFLAGHGHSVDADLTAPEIVDNAVSMLVAGTGTTAGALVCLMMLLGRDGEVIEKMREEHRQAGLGHQDLTYSVLQSLPYTQCVIKEALRLHAPVGGMFRQAEKTLEVGDYHIPRGWTVVYSIRDTHYHSDVFESRDEFKPERWMDQELTDRLHKEDSCNYMPFGHGPRTCLGKSLANLQLTVFLVELLQLTTFTLHNPRPEMVYLPVTKPADNLPVTVWSREEMTS